MKNNYIFVELNNHNELRTIADMSILDISRDTFKDINVKIDTGCPYTSIPVRKLGIDTTECYRLKQIDCLDKTIEKQISFGVNDLTSKRISDKSDFLAHNYMGLTSISFKHTIDSMTIAGVDIGKNMVRLSYDRTGNILIGMDIIGKMDNHIGMSKKIGRVIFLACPIDKINQDYLLALEEHFGLGTMISAAIVNDSVRNNRV